MRITKLRESFQKVTDFPYSVLPGFSRKIFYKIELFLEIQKENFREQNRSRFSGQLSGRLYREAAVKLVGETN